MSFSVLVAFFLFLFCCLLSISIANYAYAIDDLRPPAGCRQTFVSRYKGPGPCSVSLFLAIYGLIGTRARDALFLFVLLRPRLLHTTKLNSNQQQKKAKGPRYRVSVAHTCLCVCVCVHRKCSGTLAPLGAKQVMRKSKARTAKQLELRATVPSRSGTPRSATRENGHFRCGSDFKLAAYRARIFKSCRR